MKVLNLYAGIGGNRKKWDGVDVVSVEHDPNIAAIYKGYFPNDLVVVGDAHEYLLNHYQEYDFIWSSPPCQTHSRIRQSLGVGRKKAKPVYADLNLWQEIVFLKYNAKCRWVVENVHPYYKPFIEPNTTLNRHCVWSNFSIPEYTIVRRGTIEFSTISDWENQYEYDLSQYKLDNKLQVLRNCVSPDIGQWILKAAKNSIKKGDLIRSGLARAKSKGIYISRPKIDEDKSQIIRTLKKQKLSNREISRRVGVHHQTVANVLRRHD